MKKTVLLLVALAVAALLSGCAADPKTAAEPEGIVTGAMAEGARADLEIKEKMFIAQTNDVYLNADDYMGKTIKYQGIFVSNTYQDTDYYMVIRYGPGCCGNDGVVGFEVRFDEIDVEAPKDNDWVEVAGTLERYLEDGNSYLRLNLTGLSVLTERGAEQVLQ